MATLDVRGVRTLALKRFQASLFRLGCPPSVMGVGYFRIGEGGFIEQAAGTRVPADPDDSGLGYSTKSTIEASVDISVDPTSLGLRYFQKSLSVADMTIDGDGDILVVRCRVEQSEANAARAAEFYELGVYDTTGILMTYGTFPVETKDSLIALEHNVRIQF